MTWDGYHRRGEVLRDVVEEANRRRDGVLPMDVPGVREAFGDELTLLGVLQLRWHTRLAGQIERTLMEQPMELESAVMTGWRRTATELVGVRAILDASTQDPSSEAMEQMLRTAHRKDWVLMAAMAGKASAQDARAAAVGRRVEEKARAAYDPRRVPVSHRASGSVEPHASLLDRLKARLAA